ncbi:MAG: PQQ-binding-like beta-propeller repeat protein [Verrucomicrobiota bacterium]
MKKREFKRWDQVLVATIGLGMALLLLGCGEKDTEEEILVEVEETSAQSDWPLFRGDAGMQGVSSETLTAPLDLAWTFEPEVEEGRRRPPIDASPVIADGRVFVGTQGIEFLALDLETGDLLWSFEPEGPVIAPAGVHGDTVYFGDSYGFVYALDVETGEEKWPHYETDGKIEGGVNILEVEGGDAKVFVGSHDYFLYCFEGGTGKVMWKEETGNYIVSTPSIIETEDGEAVSFGGCDGLLHVVPAEKGKWAPKQIEIGSYVANSSAVRDGIAYVAHNGGEVMAIDIASGEVVWTVQTGTEYTASPAVDEKTLFVAGPDKRLVAMDRVTGEEIWDFRAPRGLDSSPVITGDTIWQGGMDGRIYAIDRTTGEEIWTFELGAQVKASPAVSRGMLVVGGQDGVVYGFR